MCSDTNKTTPDMSDDKEKPDADNRLLRRYRPVWVGLRGRGRIYLPVRKAAGAAAQDGAAALDGAAAGAGGQLPTGADAGPGGQQPAGASALPGAAAREGACALDWDWELPEGYRRPVPLDDDDDDDDPPHEEDSNSAVAEMEAGLAAAANGPPHIGGDDGGDGGNDGDDGGNYGDHGADNGSDGGGNDDEARGGVGDDEDGGLHTPPPRAPSPPSQWSGATRAGHLARRIRRRSSPPAAIQPVFRRPGSPRGASSAWGPTSPARLARC